MNSALAPFGVFTSFSLDHSSNNFADTSSCLAFLAFLASIDLANS
jgi:hypothetical protein